MTVQVLPWSIQGQSHEAPIQRNAAAAMFGVPVAAHSAGVAVMTSGGGHGVVGGSDLAVTQNGTPNMSVNVAAGRAIIRNGESATLGGCYAFLNDATLNVAISASDATNPRIDLVIAQVRDANYSGASNDARLTVVAGTPAASPAVPSLTSYPNCVVLAQVAVAATVTTIVTANITDKRTFAAAVGGVLQCKSTQRPSGASLRDMLLIQETDTRELLQYNATAAVFRRPWKMPWGNLVNPHILTTAYATIATHTTAQAEGLTVTADDIAGRIIEVSLTVQPSIPGGTNSVRYFLQRDGVDIRRWDFPVEALNASLTHAATLTHVETIAATHAASVYRVMIAAITNNTSVTSHGGAAYPRSLAIRDTGPASAAVPA